MKSHKHRSYFWRRAVNVALCVMLLSANMMEVLAAEELMRDEPLIEEERQSAESVSPGADATEELLESSNVEEQIDAVLALLEQADELDEEGMLDLSEKAIAAKRAYERMAWEEQTQIDADKIDKLLAFVETLNIQTLEDGNSAVDGMKIATAEIRADGMSNQALSDGSSFTVDFSKQFTLHIEVESKLNLANKKVKITVPDGLTVVEYPIPERGGMAESVTPESIDDLHSKNNYGGYCPTNGTITYSLKNTAEKNSFNIVLAPDTTLWNRTKEQALKDTLKIEVYTDDKTYQTISATPKITGKYNDAADDNRAIQTGPRLSRVGVKSGVPTAANQPFALRQIWINPDKDYIDMPQFFKKLEIKIALPYYTKDGSNIYAELDHITWDPAGQSTRLNMLDPENHKGANDNYTYTETPNNTDHTVTLTWENLYLEYGQEYFTPYFKWTSDCDVTAKDAVKWGSNSILNTGKSSPGCYEGETPTAGAASAVGGTITWQDDSTWYLYNGDCTTFSFTAQAGESMSVNGKANNQPIYNNYTSDSGITYYLGQFHVVNQGGAASAKKTVEFTYGNNKKIGVTAQKIPASTGNTVEVWYTTTENPSEQKYNGTLTSSGGFVSFTAQMAGLGEGEYFTKIKANVGSYEKDYVGYVSSRDQDPTSGYATTFGKLLTGDEATYSNFASMKMYDTDSSDSTAKSGNYTVKVTNTRGEIPLAMEQAYKEGTLERVPILSKTSATAGDTITFNGLLSSSAYPYSSNNVTTDQEIYIRLPDKITVENLKLYQEVGRIADKVFLLDAVTETVTNPQRTEIPETAYEFKAVASAEEGYKLYKITFKNQNNPAKVGWFTDGLGQYQIGISFDMNIAKDADAMTLDMRDCVRFKSTSLNSTSNNGTLAQYQVMDEGVRYSTFNVNAKGTKLSVVAARLGLTFTFGARITEKGSKAEFDATKYSNFENNKQKVYLKDADHVVDMLFTLKNETGREFSEEDAHAFYYFIPVPKNGDLWDSHMQDQPFEFDMSLTRAPELQGISAEHILVTYATEIDSKAQAGEAKHYTNTANYQTEEELLKGCTTDEAKAERWKKVKMIRIAAKPGINSIPQNAELKVNMRLEPTFNENADFVGSEINFGPCGVSPYSVGNTPNQGHNPLPRIQVEFQTGVIGGKIFIDKNFNGTYDEGTDELYKDGVMVEANHSTGNDNCTEGADAHKKTATNGTFTFTGRRADTYHVIVTNPGSTGANDDNPLKFSLPESGGKFSLDAGENTATATVILDMNKTSNDIAAAKNLMIGLQQPHTVTFKAENATLGEASTTKVWHGDKLGDVIPTVTAVEGYRFTGNWTVGDKTYTADQLKELAISSDVTVKAEVKQLYSLTYDLNGGSGAAAPATSTHIEGEKVRPDYTGTGNLKKGEDTIFVGWSEEQIPDPLQEDAAQEDINKIISADEHTMPARNVTLYAVYAVDGNGNGNPDYNDDAVHVRYHGNNGDYKDIICPHHHVAGATAKLSTNGTVSGKRLGHGDAASAAAAEVTSHTFTYDTNIFIGWSTKPILDKVIETKAEYDNLKSSIKNEVTMLEKPGNDVSDEDTKDTSKYADTDGNTNVYAVWAADRNENNVADYLEEYTLTYDGNAQEDGTVANLPTDTDIHIPNDKVTLSTAVPTHSNVDGKKVVFIGWTEAQTNSIFSRTDTAPITITKVTFESADKTVYAAWGYDENDNGTADMLETYTLTYDLNSGSGTKPETISNIAKNTEVTLTEEKNFTRNPKEIFVGWSVTRLNDALTAETEQEDLEKFLIAPGAKYRIQTKDVTLYAVWAADRNGNNTADYLEKHKLTYNGNAQQGGTVSTVPMDNNIYIPGDKAELSKDIPTHSNVDGKKVVFIGWTETQMNKIFGREATAPGTVTEVTFGSENKKVYAAWGYDENNNGTADVLETYTLTYDLNGGSGDAPTDNNIYIPGDKAELSKDIPTHSNVDGKKVVFIGWTETQKDSIFSRADKAPTTTTKVTFGSADKKVYAAWGYDENNNGTADVLETYTLTYDLNGGNEAAPEKVSGIKKNTEITLTADKNFTRNTNEVFVGWSVDKRQEALSAETTQEKLQFLIVPGAKYRIQTKDVTLYAVWAIDSNGDGTPDYQTTYTVTYDLDGGTAADGETYDEENVKPGETITIKAAPIRKGYAFAGWHDGTKTYKPGDNVTILDADLKLTAQWKKDPGTTGPTDPDESTDPSKPNGSSDPTDPDKPTDPATTGKSDKTNDNPLQTGDETNLALWLALFGISLTGIIAGLLGSKRKHSEKHNNK